jgi:RND family efflux transporter MFP subunit
MRRRTALLIAGVIVAGSLALAVLLVSLAPEPERREPPSRIPFVETVSVVAGAGAIPVRGAGIVRPSAEIDLAPQVGGRVVWVDPGFRSGRRVAAGQVVFRIDEADYQYQVREAQAALAARKVALLEAEEAAVIARDEFARFSAQRPEAGGQDTPSPLTLRQPQLEAARAALGREEARLAQANLALSRTRVTSPFDGIVRDEWVDPGQVVSADQPVGKLFATDAVEVVVSLSDADAALIPGLWETGSDDNAGRVRASVVAVYGDVRKSWPAFVDRAEASLDEETRTIKVIVRVPEPFEKGASADPPLLVGKFAEVTIEGSAPGSYFRIRRAALQPGNEVWSMRANGTVSIVPVRVLHRIDDEAFVSGALDPGAPVIIGGIRFATDGMAVRVREGRP